MTLKEKFSERLSDSGRAVSPVIGVILMVAITVILAAIIGTFVMGLGNNVDQNAQAGVSFDQSGQTVTVQLTDLGNIENAGKINVKSSSDSTCNFSGNFTEIGDTISSDKDDCNGTETITVTATINGKTNVVTNYDVKDTS